MNKWKVFGLSAAMAAMIGLAGGAVLTNAEMHADQTIPGSQMAAIAEEEVSGDFTIPEIAEAVMPTMVAITNTSVKEVENYFNYFGFGGRGNGGNYSYESVSRGSGVIIGENDTNLLIATNAHVVIDARTLTVAFIDETAANARIVDYDKENDLAVISVSKYDLSDETMDAIRIITLGSSDDLVVGESVVAIGNALGYGQSVSAGIVSALNRTITTQDEWTGEITETTGMIQTDASINPGNSGGALLNMRGELIGINSAKLTDETIEGMGYAIPINTALPILTEMANNTTDEKQAAGGSDESSYENQGGNAFLGVSVIASTEDYYDGQDLPEGCVVVQVEKDSAAEKAGIEPGDIIKAVDGKEAVTTTDLKNLISGYNSGDSAEITLYRARGIMDEDNAGGYTFGQQNPTKPDRKDDQQRPEGFDNGFGYHEDDTAEGFDADNGFGDDGFDNDSVAEEPSVNSNYEEITVTVTFGSNTQAA